MGYSENLSYSFNVPGTYVVKLKVTGFPGRMNDWILGKTGEETLTIHAIQVDILQDSNVITDLTQDTIVGKNISLTSRILPTEFTATAHLWSVPGSGDAKQAIADYVTSATSGSVVLLAETDLDDDSTSFYWITGGEDREVTYTATIAGREFSATATFDVKRPTASIESTTGDITIGDSWGSLRLSFGIPHPSGGKGYNGIFFERTLQEPSGFSGGTTSWVQIVNSGLRRYRTTGGAWYRLSATNVLDVLDYNNPAYPYQTGDSANDSPSNPLTVTMDRSVANDSFTMYLVYKPVGGGIDVPLRKVNWYWSASATGQP